MIFKKQKKMPLKTSQPMMATPIHIDDKIIIPIHYINIEVFDLKFPNIFGTIESKGIVVVEDDNNVLLSLDETLTLNDLTNNIPELEEFLTNKK